MNRLPKVFASPINKKIDNYQDSFYSNRDSKVLSKHEVNKKINEIFSSSNHIYKSRVRITLNNKVLDEIIIGKTSIYLLTIDNKKIKITDILDIEKI